MAPSAIQYYFPTVDDLLVAALVDVDDRWGVGALRDLPADRLAALDALAARREELRPELDRWWAAWTDSPRAGPGDVRAVLAQLTS